MAYSRDSGSMDHAERGREAANRSNWAEAFEAFSEADDLSPLGADDLEWWSTAAYLLGRVDVAVSARSRAHHAHLDRGDVESAVRAGVWTAFMLMNTGDLAQGNGWMSKTARLAEELPPDSVGRGYVSVLEAFRATAVEHRHEDGTQIAATVVRIGRSQGDEDLVALGLNLEGRAMIRSGRITEGSRLLDEAMVTVVSGRLSAPVAGTVYCSLIDACEEVGDLRRAREWTDALTSWCDLQNGMVTYTGQCLTHRAHVLQRNGEFAAASETAEEALARFDGAADERLKGAAFYELGEVLRIQGDVQGAERAYLRAGEWGRDPQPGLALLRLEQGKVDEAAATAYRLEAEWTSPRARIRLLPALVEVMIEIGDLESARRAASELEDLAATTGTEMLIAEAHTARGAVQLATGAAEASLVSLRKALAGWTEIEAPYEAALTRILISDACRTVGDEDTARLELAVAQDALKRLGVPTEAGKTEGAEDRHGLSARELEVLGLIATGSTNRDIADQLGLSVKTIDRHVSNILTKLGVPSRTAATSFAYEHELL